MFNLYEKFGKRENSENRSVAAVTGHDRFYQGGSRTRRKRRLTVNRRTQSAIDLDFEAGNSVLRRGRSASFENDEIEEEKGYQLMNKIDHLAKLIFNRVSRSCKDSNESRNKRHQYTMLDHGSTFEDVVESVEMEKKSKDLASSILQEYMRTTTRYTVISQLNNVGSRMDKYWFAVRDTSLKTDRLITLMPSSRKFDSKTKNVINALFLALQHPYVCPIFHVDLIEFKNKEYLIVIQPINQGSLKDLIYDVERGYWNEDWHQKYALRGEGLPLPQVQRLGRQVLEAMLFLKERGFPDITSLHSGNVIIQNGVARLAGLENTLFGFTSRIHPVVTSNLKLNHSIDVICFGHMLFEMCAGYELCSFKPTASNILDLKIYPQIVDLLGTIFEKNANRYCTIEELLAHSFFRNIDLREMRNTSVTIFRPSLTPSMINFLSEIQKRNLHGDSIADVHEEEEEEGIKLQYKKDSFLVQMFNELSLTAV